MRDIEHIEDLIFQFEINSALAEAERLGLLSDDEETEDDGE